MKKFPKFLFYCLLIFSTLFLINKFIQTPKSDKLYVYFLDVGQGDSTLIQYMDNTILIDSGPKSSEDKILSYLKQLKLKDIDFLVSTHPHEDHIGNMDEIIDTIKVKKFYAPHVSVETEEFSDLINSLNRQNLQITILNQDTASINLGDDIRVDIFYPFKGLETENLNNYSSVIKITFKETSFLFTGNAEKEVNDYLLSNKLPIQSDVLKLGHHGSNTSLDEYFLSEVSPKLAIASCGYNNSYNHPSSSVIELLNSNNIPLLRTDLTGSIILSSDGKNISIEN
ncbi:ComEC/Rec2 family competence protein [uncultured Clostridium sp.]|uniref:ComEC/Rec2 family competence protein n=1 Tax=uncultured Clostridium sp. TaxID=59620 RepID=UPI002612F463|nr:ComEC/Rec2 family competence protein [uncultured Clostridium sp.]